MIIGKSAWFHNHERTPCTSGFTTSSLHLNESNGGPVFSASHFSYVEALATAHTRPLLM